MSKTPKIFANFLSLIIDLVNQIIADIIPGEWDYYKRIATTNCSKERNDFQRRNLLIRF